MTPPALHSPPSPRAVLLEQVRAVELVLRRPAAVAAGLIALATLFAFSQFLRDGGAVDFHPELSMLPGIVGLLLPAAVWRGEERFGGGVLWTLPVDRRRHALTKVCAGWVWLMAAVAVFVLWLLALTVLTGGNILAEETLRVLPSLSVPPPGALDASALQLVRSTPHPLLWVVPFTAATGTYLLASAAALGCRHPLRWMAAVIVAFLLVNATGAATGVSWLVYPPDRVVEPLFEGRYGIDALLTARSESLHTEATLASGETIGVWRALPDLCEWASATVLWTSAGAIALWLAASRHREQRRA
jgi:hypothetical protein